MISGIIHIGCSNANLWFFPLISSSSSFPKPDPTSLWYQNPPDVFPGLPGDFHQIPGLVNIQKTMENHQFSWKIHYKSPFSIAFCMFTRGYFLWFSPFLPGLPSWSAASIGRTAQRPALAVDPRVRRGVRFPRCPWITQMLRGAGLVTNIYPINHSV